MAHSDSPEAIRASQKHYLKILGWLMVLTFITVAAHELHFPAPWNWIIGLAIAVVKAALVAMIFMHMLGEKLLINRMMLFSAIFAVALMLLCVLAYVDHVSPIF